MFAKPPIGRHKSELTTPCLLLDLDAAESNIARMAAFFEKSSCKVRPHSKTHKSPWIARKQMQAGAIGITCAKVQEAKAFIQAGIDPILIANQVVGRSRIEETAALATIADVTVCIDQFENACELSAAAQRHGVSLQYLIEVDVGLGRCGVPPGNATLDLLCRVSRLPSLAFKGVMGYEGGVFVDDAAEKIRITRERNQALVETAQLLQSKGFRVEIVSAGGSNTFALTGSCPGITEVQAGSYVTMDAWNSRYGIDFRQAISILTTVISRPTAGRVVTDAGIKALSTDHGLPRGRQPSRARVRSAERGTRKADTGKLCAGNLGRRENRNHSQSRLHDDSALRLLRRNQKGSGCRRTSDCDPGGRALTARDLGALAEPQNRGYR